MTKISKGIDIAFKLAYALLLGLLVAGIVGHWALGGG